MLGQIDPSHSHREDYHSRDSGRPSQSGDKKRDSPDVAAWERERCRRLEKWQQVNAARQLVGRGGLGDRQLEHDFDSDDDQEQQRNPPIATAGPQPNQCDSERDGANDFGLAEHSDDRRTEIQPRHMRHLKEVQDRAIETRNRAERHEDREAGEGRERAGASRQSVDVLTACLRRLVA
jgi:hypothetical protein